MPAWQRHDRPGRKCMEQGIRQAFQNSVNGAMMMLSGLGTASQKGTFLEGFKSAAATNSAKRTS
jgi:hypothetical protein